MGHALDDDEYTDFLGFIFTLTFDKGRTVGEKLISPS